MGPMGPRMNAPRGQGPIGPMNPNYAGMRPPNANMGPGLPPMPPMGAGGRPGPGWNPNPSNMNFSSPSPGSHYGPGNGPPGPGTPILPSPGSTGPYSPANHRMGTPTAGRDSANPPGDGMYPGMMKQGPGMPGVSIWAVID
jgi:hypothetical protein